ncbi:MAG: hypothetical protein QXP83_07890 [Candidatus Nezhaarchaeales archaeon]
MGGFSTVVGGGVTKLSELIIDINKDWLGRVIKNLGAPVDAGDAVRLPVLRANLEAPTVGVSFGYLAVIDKLFACGAGGNELGALITEDVYADAAVVLVGTGCGVYMASVARLVDINNHYHQWLYSGFSGADNQVLKTVAGTRTLLASEAVDIDPFSCVIKTSCAGSTLTGYRWRPTTPIDLASLPAATGSVSATDTSLTSGRFGLDVRGSARSAAAYMLSSSPSPPPVAYFEAPVVGSGTLEDPFRVQMPEEMAWEWSLNPAAKKKYDLLKLKGFMDEEIATLFPEVLSCRTNRLALTHSSLIKTDKATGKPVDYVAVVRVFDQPDRQAHLRPILGGLTALRGMVGVRELTRDEAIVRAKQIDPDLTDVDLVRISPTDPNFKIILKDYIRHREGLGVKRELIDDKLMERYLTETKGW